MISPEKKAKIKWNCRRGMLELDLILNPFISLKLDSLTDDQVQSLEVLLNFTDPELYAFFMGSSAPDSKELCDIVNLIRNCNQV